jgi:hypothetical protein
MAMRPRFTYKSGEFKSAFEARNKLFADAAFAAIREVGTTVKLEARRNIAQAGFSTKWQNALRVDVYDHNTTKNPGELAAAWVHHKIPYSGIFERGGTISPKNGKFLWVPTKFAPLRAFGNERMTAGKFKAATGLKLFQIKSRKGATLLMAKVPASKASKFAKGLARPTIKGIGKAAQGKRNGSRHVTDLTVPMFTGLPFVKIRKRFAIMQVIERARRTLAEAVAHNLRDI